MSKISDLVNATNKHCSLDSVLRSPQNPSNAGTAGTSAEAQTKKELVNHPSHYQSKNGIEAIDVIEAFDLGFNLGNVIKYILRAGKKDATVQELEKAKWYLEREINKIKGN